MIWRSSLICVTASLVVVLLAAANGAATAYAYPCTQHEESIFVKDPNHSGTGGSLGVFAVKDRDLNGNCGLTAINQTVSTAHLQDPTANSQVEVGWAKYVGSTGGLTYAAFCEAQYLNTVYWGPSSGCGQQISCCGTWAWKVVGNSTYNTFRFYVDPGANGGWVELSVPGYSHGVPYSLVGFSKGIPEAETSREGGCGTGVSDDHSGLQWWSISAAYWHDWSDNVVDIDSIRQWHYQKDSTLHYEVVKDANPANCTT